MFRPYHFLGDNCKDFHSLVLEDLQLYILTVFNESTLIGRVNVHLSLICSMEEKMNIFGENVFFF